MIFSDRRAAGRQLAVGLKHLKGSRLLVAGLPRGGVPVAYEIALALEAPLDVLVVRKLGSPHQPELAIGALAFGLEEPILYEELLERIPVPREHLFRELAEARREAARQNRLFREGRPAPEVAGRTVVVADDGLATGMTARAALEALRRLQARRLVVAVPVAAPQSVSALAGLADEVACLSQPEEFSSVSAHYADFSPTTDEEVVALLAEARKRFIL
ncbi:MAG: phosphoribosyltransferase [Elusimicrobia bacterium]|nr:phosphoribosyltransferase [Elusimicrobiota bacterium]